MYPRRMETQCQRIIEYILKGGENTLIGITRGTGLPRSEVHRYIRPVFYDKLKYDAFIKIRETNRKFYDFLLKDIIYKNNYVFVNTSKHNILIDVGYKYNYLIKYVGHKPFFSFYKCSNILFLFFYKKVLEVIPMEEQESKEHRFHS